MRDTTALTDKQVASIWVIYTETGSFRQTARRLDIAATTVARHIRADPVRFAALVQARADARAERWAELEDRALSEQHALLDQLIKDRRRISDKRVMTAAERFTVLPAAMRTLRAIGNDAAKNTQLLSGGATERVGVPVGERVTDLTDEQLIELAEEMGVPIPPGVRDRMKEPERAARPKRKTAARTKG